VVEPGRLAAALAWVLSIFSSAALFFTRNKLRQLVPWATGVMMGIAAFFTGLMLFAPTSTPSPSSTRRPPTGSGSTRCCSTRA